MSPESEAQNSKASLELLYNISRELNTALDLRTVLMRVLTLSMQNVGAINGSIIVLDDRAQPLESAIITGDQVFYDTTQQLRATYERGLAGWAARNRQAILVADTSADARWLHRPDDGEDQTGPKSAVSAPIFTRDQVIGVITLVHGQPGFFNDDHLALVRAIADQAGIAIQNARLYEESQRRTRAMSALAKSSVIITASLRLEEVIQRILEQSTDALRVEVVSLALIDHDSHELVFQATTGPQSRKIIGHRLAIGQGVAGWVAQEGRGVIVPDAHQDPRFYPELDRITGTHTRAIACAPIQAGGQVIGILEALNPLAGTFDNDALFVLTGIGSLAGTAINHAQLFERLQTAHQRYYDLFEDSMDAILITDGQGAILEINQQVEALLGLDRAVLRGLRIESLKVINPKKLGRNFEALTNEATIAYETTLKTPAGRAIPVEVYARKVRIEGQTHLQWILHDITARKNLETLRDDLISMIYHDLRSPLANVVSSLDVLENILPLQGDPTLQSLLSIAIRSTERILRLTNSLLDLRQLESGGQIANRQLTSVQSLVEDAAEALSHTLESKNLALQLSLPHHLPTLYVDSDMIRRVLINLLENAAKYTPEHSQVQVSAAPDKGGVLFAVRDHGPGIPEGDRERIFDKFTRLHGSERTRGFGLGLAFCRLAIEGHGGRIWVENAPDDGACFKFFLPEAETAASQ